MLRDESMLESLYNAYVEDDQSGGMFAGPNRKDIEKALDEIPSYLAERFIENVAKIAPESIKVDMNLYLLSIWKTMC